MANEVENQERVPDNLRSLLAVAVRSVQWSYAIFWSLSNRGQGVLEWSDGYYNGEVKTMRNVSATELKADKMGLKRSEQLRELYEFLLLEEENDQQRPGATLSPEDLTDAEWYYLVCMSFVFNEGEGLPGKAFANDQSIWLSDAHLADSKLFTRTLLAKSASIQTVICFPHLGGIIELGVTESVPEDPSLIQHIKTSFLDFSKPFCTKKSSAPHGREGEPGCIRVSDNHEIVNTMQVETFCSVAEDMRFDQDDLKMGSSDDCSKDCEHDHQTRNSMDDSFSNYVQESMTSSNFISPVFLDHRCVNNYRQKELQEDSGQEISIGIANDLHYIRTVSTVLRSSHLRPRDQSLIRRDCDSSFLSWKNEETARGHTIQIHQKILKKILFDVPSMHTMPEHKNGRDNLLFKPESNTVRVERAELQDKLMETDKFLVLKSMVPSLSMTDEASVLSNTIRHLIELEARVDELESCIDLPELEASKKYPDFGCQTPKKSENPTSGFKKPPVGKRKAYFVDETETEPELSLEVKVKDQEVLIHLRCPWRDYLLHDIMDAMNSLNLDAHSVQTSTVGGFLALFVQSKLRGTAVASPRMVKEVLSAVVGPC